MDQEQRRLEAIVSGDERIVYFQDLRDNEYGHVRWSVYGAIATNEIIVKVGAHDTVYYAAAPSSVISPPMVERIFGIDIADDEVSRTLSETLWAEHGDELIAQDSED